MVGVAQALVREGLWVLSLFGVVVRAQNRGLGRELLDAALAYGREHPGLILCSRDPRAMRRYAQAGFALHPSVTAWGRVQRGRLPETSAVRSGGPEGFALAAEVDRRVRGASHGPDLGTLVDEGAELLWHDGGHHDDGRHHDEGRRDGGGYVVVRDGRPVVLAADDETTATALLFSALRRAEPDTEIEVAWLTANQQWAIRACLRAGLELHPVGPVMISGRPDPPHPYIPNGAYG